MGIWGFDCGRNVSKKIIPVRKGLNGCTYGMYPACPKRIGHGKMEPEGKLEIRVHHYPASYSNDVFINTSCDLDLHVFNKNKKHEGWHSSSKCNRYFGNMPTGLHPPIVPQQTGMSVCLGIIAKNTRAVSSFCASPPWLVQTPLFISLLRQNVPVISTLIQNIYIYICPALNLQ